MAPHGGASDHLASPDGLMQRSKTVLLSPHTHSRSSNNRGMDGQSRVTSMPSLILDTAASKRRAEVIEKERSHRSHMRKALAMTALPMIADGKTAVGMLQQPSPNRSRAGFKAGSGAGPGRGATFQHWEDDITPSLARIRSSSLGAISRPAVSYDVDEEPLSDDMKSWMSATLASIPKNRVRPSPRGVAASPPSLSARADRPVSGSRTESQANSRRGSGTGSVSPTAHHPAAAAPSQAATSGGSAADAAPAPAAESTPSPEAPAKQPGGVVRLPTAEEVMARLSGASEGNFSDDEVARMHSAFVRFKVPGTHEVHRDDLAGLMQYLGYLKASPEKMAEIADEVSQYSTMDFDDFVSFASKYGKYEYDEIRRIFAEIDEDSSGQLNTDELANFLTTLGITPLRKIVAEALDIVDADRSGHLDFEELVHLIAVYRQSEGFTREEIKELHEAFESELDGSRRASIVRRQVAAILGPDMPVKESLKRASMMRRQSLRDEAGVFEDGQQGVTKPEAFDWTQLMPTSRLSSVLLKFYGPASHEECSKLGEEALRGRAREGAQEEDRKPPTEMNFAEVILWARRVREAEFARYRAQFLKQDADNNGSIDSSELRSVIKDLGYSLLEETIQEFMDEADEEAVEDGGHPMKDGRLDYDEFVNLMLLFRERDGFSNAEMKELLVVFSRFDDDGSGEVEVLELADILRYMGHNVKLDDVQRLLAQVDFNFSGSLDLREFLRFMRLQREEQVDEIDVLFKEHCDKERQTVSSAIVPLILAELGFEHELQTEFQAPSPQLKFEELVHIVDQQRAAKVAVQRRSAGFSEAEIEKFRELFKKYDIGRTGTIDAKEVTALVESLGFAIGTKEEQEKVLHEIDKARDAAAFFGVEDVGTKGTGPVNFWVLLQFLRVFYRRDDKRVLDREARAMEQTRLSQAEVDQFREVFMTWWEKDNVFKAEEEENLTGAVGVQKQPKSPEEDVVKELSKDCLRRLLKSLGLNLKADERKKLERHVDDFETGGTVDFADFLRLMRWMLDTDFAGINGTTAKS